MGAFPSPSDRFTLRVALDSDNAAKWYKLIKSYISAQPIDFESLDKLLGRLSFDSANIFGKFARSLAKPLYDKLHTPSFPDELDGDLITNLRWGPIALACDLSRSVWIPPLLPRFIIYADGSWGISSQRGGIPAILIGRQSGRIFEIL